jgi:hypothetical protein
MITLKEWLETVDYRITEGSEYMWDSYGSNSYNLSSWDGNHDGNSFGIIFDTKTQEVYEVQAHDYANNRAYRIINPDYQSVYRKEAQERTELENQAWDDVDYVDLEEDDDWFQKALAIKAGETYDTRVKVPIDFSDEELLKYMTIAHERDITFNQLIEQVLVEFIEREELARK